MMNGEPDPQPDTEPTEEQQAKTAELRRWAGTGHPGSKRKPLAPDAKRRARKRERNARRAGR